MKKVLSVFVCLLLVFSAVSFTAYARLNYITNTSAGIKISGSYVVGSGSGLCDPDLVESCTINVTIQKRTANSSNSWTNVKTFVGYGDTSCSKTGSVLYQSGMEYRTKVMVTAYPYDVSVVDYAYDYSNIIRP